MKALQLFADCWYILLVISCLVVGATWLAQIEEENMLRGPAPSFYSTEQYTPFSTWLVLALFSVLTFIASAGTAIFLLLSPHTQKVVAWTLETISSWWWLWLAILIVAIFLFIAAEIGEAQNEEAEVKQRKEMVIPKWALITTVLLSLILLIVSCIHYLFTVNLS